MISFLFYNFREKINDAPNKLPWHLDKTVLSYYVLLELSYIIWWESPRNIFALQCYGNVEWVAVETGILRNKIRGRGVGEKKLHKIFLLVKILHITIAKIYW